MDAPSSPSDGPGRRMVKPREPAPRARRARGSTDPRSGGSTGQAIPWRGLGLAAVIGTLLLAIVLAMSAPRGDGTAQVFATASPTGGQPSASAAASGDVLAIVPTIEAPVASLIASRSLDLVITVPDDGPSFRGLELRVYRNVREVATQRLRSSPRVTIRAVPLRRGENRLTAALADDRGTGPRSEPVVVVVDDVGPPLEIREPRPDDTLPGTIVTLRGTSEPGAAIVARNETEEAEAETTASPEGAFRVQLPLAQGDNVLTVRAFDALGNRSDVSLPITGSGALTQARIDLKPATFRLRSLPARMEIVLHVSDPQGRPIDGASVTFSLSPPGLDTATYDTVSVDGVATWPEVILPREGAIEGDGLVTARVTLKNGNVLQASADFAFL